ncbi:MAG: hydroxymethylglutaryl-CoA reductase, degradative [Proteobacteria bacterium]|nr:hydroxymethylglutaryl-CoA reductase, degradative [Pseudomonadota bacterium]MDA0992131.1 hydroxymethylglutaryl-CoA reductase, degradative [Pseudomonadota bacterium]
MSDSRLAGFYRLAIEDRIRSLSAEGFIDRDAARLLTEGRPLLPVTTANRMIENVIGVFGLPFGVAPNFLVNDKDYVVPMVVEEPSIVAGVSGAAKLFRASGGFVATSTDPILIGQIQLGDVRNPDVVIESLKVAKQELTDFANQLQPNLLARGGGVRDIEFFKHQLPGREWIVVLHLLVDTRDAMGANVVNSICESVAARVSAISAAGTSLCILSNLADRSLVTVHGKVSLELLASSGHSAEEVRDAIVRANEFANVDPYRAATHNKGIMNGIDAVAIATGNDWRAIEAGAHAYAARHGAYRALTSWTVLPDGDLSGELTLPLKVGIVGGSLESNPGARLGLAICGTSSATELAEVMAATGLAQNFAALKALVSDGIQKGHMSLHARSVAATAGVPDGVFDKVVSGMIESGEIKTWKAKELTAEMSGRTDKSDLALSGNAARGAAAGKVILLGEHAVVYNRSALALPLANALTATVSKGADRVKLSVPDWNLMSEWSPRDHQSAGVAAVLALIMAEFGVGDRCFNIHVLSRIPIGMGLGSSAAFAVAVIRAFDSLLGMGKRDSEVDQLAFRCEEIVHGTPSGIDNNVATFNQPVLFNKGDRQMRSVSLAESPPLVIASSASRGDTKDQIDSVRRRYESNKTLISRIFDEIGDISIAGAAALQAREYERLGAMMNVCHGLLNALEVSTPELERMVDIARRAGAVGAKLTGSGGGGSIVALCPGKVSEVGNALSSAGYQIVQMEA